jgi:hypothetical protein
MKATHFRFQIALVSNEEKFPTASAIKSREDAINATSQGVIVSEDGKQSDNEQSPS